jgi:plastocyanin
MCFWKRSRLPGSRGQQCLKRFFYVPCILLICLLPLVLISCQNGGTTSTSLTIVMTNNSMTMNGLFTPRESHITVGQTVTWINKGTMHHTVTADDDSFNSGFVEPGASYSHTFLRPGQYPYHCVLHGSEEGTGMAGVIIVTTASSTPTPPNGGDAQTLFLA